MTDIEIAQSTKMNHIKDVAIKLNLLEDDIETYGKYKAKINVENIVGDKNMGNEFKKLILPEIVCELQLK